MKSLKIKNDLYWVGALDPELRVFDIIMHTPYGTTYNSYVVKGSEKTAVIETVKVEFFEQYLERLKDLEVNLKELSYIVVNHTEPDHAGSVAKLLTLAPNAKVVGSPIAIKYLKAITNTDFEYIEVREGATLSLGDKTLKFLSVPMLHWPDSMYTYVEEDKTLFTCDSFGSHYSFDGVFNDLIENKEDYLDALKYYFDCIMGPFKPFMLKAINKIEKLDIDTICPGHGPVLRSNPFEVVNKCKEWCQPVKKNEVKKIVIPYVTAYGYTEVIAKEIVKGIESKGNFDIKLLNVIEHDLNDVVAEVASSDAFICGSPTILADMLEPIRELLTKLNPVIHGGKYAGAFGSYGWSGEAVPRIDTRLAELKMKTVAPSININFKPSEKELEESFNYGVAFADVLMK
ncbi:FprA family A-type flavoprotein [Clostridium mediterraneense]|uniref:FprA family A-type flavoprotein n=1 Tax=Clostridium mediterraneense TaxID=1805472 RepID=UPI0008298B30|nr:FprA family A-type flavoprotein [Clostridium mediterraneense]